MSAAPIAIQQTASMAEAIALMQEHDVRHLPVPCHSLHRPAERNNTEGLRAQVRRTITAFLLAQMNSGAFRSTTPSTAFLVDVSEQLKTPTVIFAGKLIARVGLATNKPAEVIILRISQDSRALEAELAAAEG